MNEEGFQVWHFYGSGDSFRTMITEFTADEQDLMLEFISGLRLCGTEYQVFKGDALYNEQTGKTVTLI